MNTFNTGRIYDGKDQVIKWKIEGYYTVVFIDAVRNISGTYECFLLEMGIPIRGADVLIAYDSGNYKELTL